MNRIHELLCALHGNVSMSGFARTKTTFFGNAPIYKMSISCDSRTQNYSDQMADLFEACNGLTPKGRCSGCGKWEEKIKDDAGGENKTKKFKVCGGCSAVRYCSLKCQAKGWTNGHQQKCGKSKITEVVAVLLTGCVPVHVDAADAWMSSEAQEIQMSELEIPKCIMDFAVNNVCPCLLARAETRDRFRHVESALTLGSITCQNHECKRVWSQVQAACYSLFTARCRRNPQHWHTIPMWFCSAKCQRVAGS